jgi:hypothetical protein
MKLLIIIIRRTIDSDFFLHRLKKDKIAILHQQKGFINSTCFDQWINDVPPKLKIGENYTIMMERRF